MGTDLHETEDCRLEAKTIKECSWKLVYALEGHKTILTENEQTLLVDLLIKLGKILD